MDSQRMIITFLDVIFEGPFYKDSTCANANFGGEI